MATKKKKRYKVHYDRLIAQLIMLGLIIFVIVWIASFFTSNDENDSNRGVIAEAVEAGRRDAEKVLHTVPNSMERYESVLRIKARESELRSKGYGHAADDYIESAKEFISKHNIK